MATPTKKKYERNLGKLFQIVLNKDYKWYNPNYTQPNDDSVYFISSLRRRGGRGIYVYDVEALGKKGMANLAPIANIPAIDLDNWINNKVSETSRKNDYWRYVEYAHT